MGRLDSRPSPTSPLCDLTTPSTNQIDELAEIPDL
jgi:hypothetical protein